MINQRYSASDPCTSCGRTTCEGCITGYVLNDTGDGLDYVEADAYDRAWADLYKHQYDAAMLAHRIRQAAQ